MGLGWAGLGWLGQCWSPDVSCPQAAQQLRFVRQWSVFGKTLCRALPELLGAALGLVVLAVAYVQLAVLVGDYGSLGGRLSPGHTPYSYHLLCSWYRPVWTHFRVLPRPSGCCAQGLGVPPCALLSPGACPPFCARGCGYCAYGVP